jgi:DNA-binding response OmpR family regulator
MTFLIVEDDHSTAAFIERILADEGRTCLVARDTGEASLLLETVAVDAVVVDLDLSGNLDALDWFEETVALLPEIALRSVILLSEFPLGERARRIRELDIGVLLKPFVSKELRRIMSGDDEDDDDGGGPAGSPLQPDDRKKPSPKVKPPEEDI